MNALKKQRKQKEKWCILIHKCIPLFQILVSFFLSLFKPWFSPFFYNHCKEQFWEMEMSLQKILNMFYRCVSGVAGKKELVYLCGKLING